METRRWVNRYQPQTLVSGTVLLYLEGLFNLVRGDEVLLALGVVMFPAAYLIANDKRIGWRLGLATASLAVIVRILRYGISTVGLISLLFPVALVALLAHPASREHQRIWFD